MKPRSRRGAGLFGLLAFMAACNQVVGIHEGIPREEGDQPALPCSSIADCTVDEPECRQLIACNGNVCVFEDKPAGTPLSKQAPGDCKEVVCNGAGGVAEVPIAEDVPEEIPDDGNPCTRNVCEGTELKLETVTNAKISCYTGPPLTEGKGQCKAGYFYCNANGQTDGVCKDEVKPEAETCETPFDEDCDGQANEEGTACVCHPGEISDCYTGPPETRKVGICHDGKQSCKPDGLGYGECFGEQTPETETCDTAMLDEDCDGRLNETGTDCTCGDGYMSNDEDCDDGNTIDGDACPATCDHTLGPVAAGGDHTCARIDGFELKCWGSNSGGALGLGDGTNRGDGPDEMGSNLPFVQLGNGKAVSAMAAGNAHICALLNDGSVKCWGTNDSGQLGLGDDQNRGDGPNQMGDALPAVDLGTGKSAIAIAAGWRHTCALLNDGSVKCWGYNQSGQLGLSDTLNRGDGPNQMGDALPAVDLGAGKSATVIVTGNVHTCALLNDGSVKCWGFSYYGQLGLGDTLSRGDGPTEMGDALPAVNLGAGKSATAIIAGSWHTCALLNDGSVKCWGYNSNGQLGLGDTLNRGDGPTEMGDALLAVNLGTGKSATALAAGAEHTCALLNDGSVKCWGFNAYGQLGLGDTLPRGDGPTEMGDALLTVNLGTGKSASTIAAGRYHTCALLNDGAVKCWGYNSSGQLGLGDEASRGDAPSEMGAALPAVSLW